MRQYKDTFVGKSSALSEALGRGEKEAKKVYEATTKAFFELYGDEDARWFLAKHKQYN